jgi:hypothetical protein
MDGETLLRAARRTALPTHRSTGTTKSMNCADAALRFVQGAPRSCIKGLAGRAQVTKRQRANPSPH